MGCPSAGALTCRMKRRSRISTQTLGSGRAQCAARTRLTRRWRAAGIGVLCAWAVVMLGSGEFQARTDPRIGRAEKVVLDVRAVMPEAERRLMVNEDMFRDDVNRRKRAAPPVWFFVTRPTCRSARNRASGSRTCRSPRTIASRSWSTPPRACSRSSLAACAPTATSSTPRPRRSACAERSCG